MCSIGFLQRGPNLGPLDSFQSEIFLPPETQGHNIQVIFIQQMESTNKLPDQEVKSTEKLVKWKIEVAGPSRKFMAEDDEEEEEDVVVEKKEVDKKGNKVGSILRCLCG